VATYLRSHESKHPPKPLYGDWSPEPTIDGEVITPSQATLELLKRRGYLTEKTVEEEQEYFVKIAIKIHQIKSRLMPSYIFMPTYSCNLRCPYCFQDHMRTNTAFKHLLQTMQPEMVDRIFAAMPQIEEAHGVTNDMDLSRDITLFGGEPLLAESRPIVEYIINKAQALGKARISAVTNGWEKTGDQKIRIGNITENSEVILNEELNQTWRNRTVVTNPVCRKCRYSISRSCSWY
jgi:uncharacterized protein